MTSQPRRGTPSPLHRPTETVISPYAGGFYRSQAVVALSPEQLPAYGPGRTWPEKRIPARQRFLTELTLDPPDATSDEAGVPLRDEDYLILSTIHSAKGQEWQAVTLLNAVDGCIPSDLATGGPQEIEEERRLLYVAMTRAKDHLQIVVPQRFYVTQQQSYGDRHVYAGRTRFIPAGMAPLFESRVWPEIAAATTTPSAPPLEVMEVLSKMKAMWK